MQIPHSYSKIINDKYFNSPGGGIGRRKGLKIPRGQPRAGSTPAASTTYLLQESAYRYFL